MSMPIFAHAPVWIQGSKLNQAVLGVDWVIEVEGDIIAHAGKHVVTERNLFGFKKNKVVDKYFPGELFPSPTGLCYVDQSGNLRKITKDCKPKVVVSKIPINMVE